MKLTIKFLKEWGIYDKSPMTKFTYNKHHREKYQRWLDGGIPITRKGGRVDLRLNDKNYVWWIFGSPKEAIKFKAALNKLRRPLHLLRKELDDDWSERVKARDHQVCVLCGVRGPKQKEGKSTFDPLNAHHWLKTKSRAGMARWARPCGVTVHFAEHIHTLHENPCWNDLAPIYDHVVSLEGEEAIQQTLALSKVKATEARIRKAWFNIKS